MIPKPRPTIAVDARTYSADQIYTGTSIYLTSVLEPLLEAGYKVTLLSNAPFKPEHKLIKQCSTNIIAARNNWAWEFKEVPNFLKSESFDVYFAPGNRGISWRKVTQTRRVLAFLDVIPYKFPSYYILSNKAYFLRHELIPQLIALFWADDIVTISRSSMCDIKRCFRRDNVATLPFNLAPVTTPKPKRIKRQFVYVGGDNPRKRIDNLGKAFAQFYSAHPDYKLILIGRADPRFDPTLYRLSQQEGVVSTGYISESEKLRVIAESTALIYPSLYEGFGLAIAEGIQADIPVLAGDGGAQKEVGRDAVLRIDPQNVDTILAGMETVLLPEVQEKLREARIAQRRILVGPHNAQIIVDYFTQQVALARRIS